MRTFLALLALLLAVAVIGWALAREPAAPGTEDLASDPTEPAGASPALVPGAGRGVGLAGNPRASAPAVPAPPPSPGGPPAISYGALRIRLKLPDGTAATTGVRVDVEPLGPPPPYHPLALGQEDGTWLYERLPVGRYRVRAFVSGFQDATVEAQVDKDAEGAAEIALLAGAEAAYHAVLYSGETPDLLQVELLDGRGVRVGGTFHTGGGVAYVPPSVTRKLPGEGRVQGLKPGTYRLRATSEAGESDEQTFVAKVGEPAVVELKIRK